MDQYTLVGNQVTIYFIPIGPVELEECRLDVGDGNGDFINGDFAQCMLLQVLSSCRHNKLADKS